jgi:hypothetical protein
VARCLATCNIASDTLCRAGRGPEDLTALYRLHNNASGSPSCRTPAPGAPDLPVLRETIRLVSG